MSTYVHKDHDTITGQVLVGTRNDWNEYANPERTCLHRMRPWTATDYHGNVSSNLGYCLMEKGHRGRHATVVHYCDLCGKTRRGDRAHQHGGPEGDIGICYMCAVIEPDYRRRTGNMAWHPDDV